MNTRMTGPRGATLVEFIVVAPTLLTMTLAMMQTALMFHAKSNLNYATFEAARAGAIQHARPAAIQVAFARAMIGYYGGGRDTGELAASHERAFEDLVSGMRIEILSPTRESFDDYHSPRAAHALGVSSRVIPNTHLALLDCPADRPACPRDPASNRSGQSLRDANLLKLRVTYGIPRSKQVPLAGRFFVWAVSTMFPTHPDAFRRALLAQGRIPVVAHVTLRMQSDAIENHLLASTPGPGNHGRPLDPGAPAEPEPLPECRWADPLCTVSEDETPFDHVDPDDAPGAGDDLEGLQCTST